MERTVINAFHKDYVKTYEPTLMQQFRTASANKKASMTLTEHVEEVRKTKPSHGTVFGITEKAISVAPKEMMKRKKPAAEITEELIERLKPRSYHTYAKAGTPKGKK